jgi:hypothetical protein
MKKEKEKRAWFHARIRSLSGSAKKKFVCVVVLVVGWWWLRVNVVIVFGQAEQCQI